MDKTFQCSTNLSYSQVPMPVKELFHIPCNLKLCVSNDLRPTAKLLFDIGHNLVLDQYSDDNPELASKQPEQQQERPRKSRRKSVDENSSRSRSGSDTESETSSSQVSVVWKYDEDNFPVPIKRAKMSCDITDDEVVQKSMMEDCVERLRWEKHLPYRCPTCSFASQSKFVLNSHLEEGHSWVMHSFSKLGGITCAFKHRKRFIAKSFTEFYEHMLHFHDIKVSMRRLALSTPPSSHDCPRCFYSSTIRTDYFNHCLSCSDYLHRRILQPERSDQTWLFYLDGSNINILKGSLVKQVAPFQQTKTKFVENARRLLDDNSSSTVTTSTLQLRAASEVPPGGSLTVRIPHRLTNPNILRKPSAQSPELSRMMHLRNETAEQNQSKKITVTFDKETGGAGSKDGCELLKEGDVKTKDARCATYLCELCNGVALGIEAMVHHFSYRHGIIIKAYLSPSHSCRDCGKKFWTKAGIANHTAFHGCEIGMRCPFCLHPFMKEVIYSHISVTHPEHFDTMQKKGYCLLCDNDDDHPLDLNRHWYEGHNLKMITFKDDKDTLIRIFIPAGRSVNENGELVGDAETYTCPKCPAVFSSRLLLRDHLIRTGHRLSCTMDSCNAEFTDRFTLMSHLTVAHADDKRMCRWCPNFSADSAVDLNKHLREFHSPKDPVLKIHRVSNDVAAIHS